MLSKLDLEPKGEGHIRIRNTITLDRKHATQNKFEQGVP